MFVVSRFRRCNVLCPFREVCSLTSSVDDGGDGGVEAKVTVTVNRFSVLRRIVFSVLCDNSETEGQVSAGEVL